jgi:hypothetical protein
MWQPQWAATIWKIAGSGVSIKLLSVMKLLSAIKTGICINFAVIFGRDSGLDWSPLFFSIIKPQEKYPHTFHVIFS